ncbi:MAG: polyprenyl synthetase family protein [Fimbriimonadales bacterium]
MDETIAELEQYLGDRFVQVEQALERYLPPQTERPRQLPSAMRYAVLEGGKRLRPILCGAAAEACGGTLQLVMPTACALELIHAFSLVHDDLPALDNDTLRRGKPTVWCAYGEAMAVLTGDALFAMAFELIAKQAETLPADRVVQVLALITQAVGVDGMVGGQVEDILSEGTEPTSEGLAYIHSRKTGALIRACVLAGAILSGATLNQQRALETYSTAIGLAFQIVDDILNETSTPEALGKSTQSDRARGKATYPRLFGLEESWRRAETAVHHALESLTLFDERANPLRWLAQYTLLRQR